MNTALEDFYKALADLHKRLSGGRMLKDCDGSMAWPERGVYFFFEAGETRPNPPNRPRVTRVGTHALKARSKSTLWGRLKQHQGSRDGGGNHRGSVFRKHAGRALIARDGMTQGAERWGKESNAPRDIRDAEREHEGKVSAYLGNMNLLWVSVPDAPGESSLRGVIERGAIALLSAAPEHDQRSAWLGNHADRDEIRRSGLWNVRHVGEPPEADFLTSFRRAIVETPKI